MIVVAHFPSTEAITVHHQRGHAFALRMTLLVRTTLSPRKSVSEYGTRFMAYGPRSTPSVFAALARTRCADSVQWGKLDESLIILHITSSPFITVNYLDVLEPVTPGKAYLLAALGFYVGCLPCNSWRILHATRNVCGPQS